MQMQTLQKSDSVKDRSAGAGKALHGSLAGKVVLVTGGGSGLGAALCRQLAEAGADVAVCDIHGDKAASHAQSLEGNGGRIHSTCFDVGDPAAAERAISDIIDQFGRLDVLINNAGTDKTLSLSELTTDDWLRVINTNLNGPFFLAKHASEHMKKWVAVISSTFLRPLPNAPGPMPPPTMPASGACLDFPTPCTPNCANTISR